MAEKRLKPAIRFNGYGDAWELRKLSELADFSKGQGYTKSDLRESGTPIILYGRLYTKYQPIIREVDTFADVIPGAVFSKGGEVILPSSGETSEDIAIASSVDKSGFLLGGGLNVVFPHEELQSAFLAIELSYGTPHNALAKRAQGKSVVHLYNEDLKQVSISFPSTDEQAKISSFFDNIDNLITLHLREFTKSNSSIFVSVSIYANGLPAAWELRKAKDLFTSTADKGHPELPVLSATQDRGMIKRDDNGINIFHDKKNEEGYKRVVPGQFVIHLRSFQGGFAHSAIEGITSPAYTVFGFQEPKNHDDNYWKYIFSSKEFIRRLETVTYGIRDGRSISYDEFLTMVFSYPQKEEQARIAAFLDKTTDLITLHLRKYSELFL